MASTVRERILVVVGVSPESFSSEAISFFPSSSVPSFSLPLLVWVNKHHPPPPPPPPFTQWEVHYPACADDIDSLGIRWPKAPYHLLVICGAGISLPFTGLKASQDIYPFDKDMLLLSCATDPGEDSSPTSFIALKFMAQLRLAYLKLELTGFHRWLARQVDSLVAILTFNIDSLEKLALEGYGNRKVLELHGDIKTLIKVEDLEVPYQRRKGLGETPVQWQNIEQLEDLIGSELSCWGSHVKRGSFWVSGDEVRSSKRRKLVAEEEEEALHGWIAGKASVLERGRKVGISRLKKLYLGNCLYSGEEGDKDVGKVAKTILVKFIAEEKLHMDKIEELLVRVNSK